VLVALRRPLAAARFATAPSNRELAAELCISVETVKFHLHALFELFGIADLPQHRKRAALARLALEQGAVAPRELREGRAHAPPSRP
jgi:DNA-binding CsgD family transcriptional regulator